jgi:hypothetical protein
MKIPGIHFRWGNRRNSGITNVLVPIRPTQISHEVTKLRTQDSCVQNPESKSLHYDTVTTKKLYQTENKSKYSEEYSNEFVLFTQYMKHTNRQNYIQYFDWENITELEILAAYNIKIVLMLVKLPALIKKV